MLKILSSCGKIFSESEKGDFIMFAKIYGTEIKPDYNNPAGFMRYLDDILA